MQMYDLIQKTRRKQPLTEKEIRHIVTEFTAGHIPDYMMSAWLMAVCCQGLTTEETAALTFAMRDSGECLDLSGIGGITVDKHSTGGIGDKTTLLLAPIVAACGGFMPKMSGRGLGFTGGTIDKLESIPGFCTDLTMEQMLENTRRVGCCVAAQSGGLTPADKKIYDLRNLTAAVDSIPLICSSIMSKKLALGADCLLLDVKFGSGAFMKTLEDARRLARSMVAVGKSAGKRCRAVITNMDAPLGEAVGNALEVAEVIEILKGTKANNLSELTLWLAAYMLELTGSGTLEECRNMAGDALHSGRALSKFREMIAAQGGNTAVIDYPRQLPQSCASLTVRAKGEGYVSAIASEEVGLVCLSLGTGRTPEHPRIDSGAGIRFHCAVGDRIRSGDALFTVYAQERGMCDAAADRIMECMQFTKKPAPEPAMLFDVIE